MKKLEGSGVPKLQKRGGVALFDQPTPQSSTGEPARVSINRLHPNPHQPRTAHFDEPDAELVASIRANGVLVPILARAIVGGYYEIVDGHRRLQAAREANLTHVPVTICNANDNQLELWGLIANVQREDLHPVDLVRAVARLYEDFKAKNEVSRQRGEPGKQVQQELADAIGWGLSRTKKVLRCRHIPDAELDRLKRDSSITLQKLLDLQSLNYRAYEDPEVTDGPSRSLWAPPTQLPQSTGDRLSDLMERARTATAAFAPHRAALDALETELDHVEGQIVETRELPAGEPQPVPEPLPTLPPKPKPITWPFEFKRYGQLVAEVGITFPDSTKANEEDAMLAMEAFTRTLKRVLRDRAERDKAKAVSGG